MSKHTALNRTPNFWHVRLRRHNLPIIDKTKRVGMPPTLLIVDDSKVSRMMIRSKVQQLQPGWAVLEAASGEEAVAMVRERAPDFITMDVNMPGINGFEAVEQIRTFNTSARVAMLTANIQEASRDRAAALKVTFVKKPATELAIREAMDHFLAVP